jgi:hypothetical protein
MISKRKQVAVRRTARKANNNKYFILAGIAAAGLGIYFLAGDQIKALFKPKGDEEEEKPKEDPKVLPPGPVTPKKEPGLDINKKLLKGVKGEEVKRLQYIINYIAGLRGAKKFQTPSGYVVNYPISADGSFGSDSQAGAYNIDPNFKTKGYTTLHEARKKLAYLAGYYGKQFPGSLVNTSKYKDYQAAYKSGEIEANKLTVKPVTELKLDIQTILF